MTPDPEDLYGFYITKNTTTATTRQRSLGNKLPQMLQFTPWIISTKNGRPRNQPVGTRTQDFLDITAAYPRIHFKSLALRSHLPCLCDLVHHLWSEQLTAESRIHSHHQRIVCKLHRFRQHGCRRPRVYGYSGRSTQRPDLPKSAVQMRTRLHMNAQSIGSCFHKPLQMRIRILNHEMDIHHATGLMNLWSQGADHSWTNGDIRYKVPIHDVKMHKACTRAHDYPHFLPQPGKIRGQQGRKNKPVRQVFLNYTHIIPLFAVATLGSHVETQAVTISAQKIRRSHDLLAAGLDLQNIKRSLPTPDQQPRP